MHTIEATYRINTPMFIAGAEQDKEAELRLPSFKGALRFWWRALAYGRYQGDLAQIRKKEDEIFGSTSKQSQLLMSIIQYPTSTTYNFNNLFVARSGLRYLGYGVPEANRNYIDKATNFTVVLKSKEMACIDVVNSIKLLGLLGGLGSRSRKGYGSLTLTSMIIDKEISHFDHPKSVDQLNKIINNILPQECLPINFPLYSAFSQHTRIELLGELSDPTALLNLVGLQMQRYRSWGHHGEVNRERSEQNFPKDHDWIRDLQQDIPPKRMIFGLPYNNIELVNLDKNNINVERRASPLFLHIHYFDENKYGAIATILESQFLPKSICINTGQKRLESKVDYSVLHQFIDGRIGPRDNKTKEFYFPNRKPILGVQVNKEGSK
jgi:CRISPR-associated protein Cmr1